MPVMSTRGSISVRFCNHLVPRPPVTVSYRVADTPGDTGTTYSTRSVTTSSGTYTVAVNEQLYDTPGAYYWICPAGVTSVCVFCIGGGGSSGTVRPGGGGAYAYINNYSVTPGQGYLVVVGAGGYLGVSGSQNTVDESVSYGSAPRASGTGYNGNAFNTTNYQTFYSGGDYNNARTGGDASWFNSFTTVFAGGGENGLGGFNPSSPGTSVRGGVGGVGYYNPAYPGGGQRGGGGWYNQSKYQVGSMSPYVSPSVEYGGGGGAGAGGPFGDLGIGPAEPGSAGGGFDSTYLTGDASHTEAGNYYASGGGGMGVYGISNTGADGSEIFSNSKATYGSGGGGGSGGQPGIGGKLQISGGGPGGKYGGGAGAGNYDNSLGLGALGQGASGAVRIIWGAGRSFANTNTASTTTSVTIPLPAPRTYRVSNQSIFETPGRYTWIVPAGVTSISVMAVGGGGAGGPGGVGATGSASGGGGGGYAYIYNYSVTPGTGYTIQVGAGGGTTERLGTIYWDVEDNGTGTDKGALGGGGGIASWFNDRSTCRGGGGTDGNSGTWMGSGYLTNYAFGGYYAVGAGLSGDGKAGGNGDQVYSPPSGPAVFGGGGGAGTQAPKGGYDLTGASGYSGGSSGGGGGGGYGYSLNSPAIARSGGGGGGIGIYGITATAPGSGAAGTAATSSVNSGGGGGGSGGQPGYPGQDFTGGTGGTTPFSSDGGKYGGGGGGGEGYSDYGRGCGGHGVVRIIWGGSRAYPSTDTGDTYTSVTF